MISEPNQFDPKILVVDDDPENLTRYLRRLGRLGYTQVASALSAKETQTKLEEEFFDLIVADMRMEADDSGFVIIEEVKARKITSVVIVLTANDTVADCRRAFKAGAWDYISKSLEDPFEILHQSVQEAMAYIQTWGSKEDKDWIRKNLSELLDKHFGNYIAVMNNAVVAVAATREAVEAQLKTQKLPLVMTVIEKVDYQLFSALPKEMLLIFVEGPTDVAYLKKAMLLLGRTDLAQNVLLDTIGNRLGNRGGGSGNLKGGFTFLQENKLITNKVLFLFDRDVNGKELPNQCEGNVENLYVRRMGEHDPEQRGIEWFFAKQIFEEGIAKGFVNKIVTKTTQKTGTTFKTKYEVIDKKRFCAWLCTERESTPEDFAGFTTVFAIIEEILKLP